VIQEFDLRLDELHNDSTTISLFGAYEDAAEDLRLVLLRNGRRV
jgi:hypothetical protein